VRGLSGKHAIVTGGAQGIGRAVVERLREEGVEVVVFDVDREKGADVALAPGVTFELCDVSTESDVAAATSRVVERHGGVDILVNNAGLMAYFDSLTMAEADWERVLAVDLKGAWLCAKYAIPVMRARGGGAVVNVSSIHAFMTATGVFPYPVAKAGLVGLTRSLALDFGPDGIRVNAVCPGYVRTKLLDEWFAREVDPAAAERHVVEAHPLRRIGSPSDIASVVTFLGSEEARFVSGALIVVDGGLTARFST
jgi:NAD(P)-dependent dehydrogenase (short-subunit alcohol dehydrogenase family)